MRRAARYAMVLSLVATACSGGEPAGETMATDTTSPSTVAVATTIGASASSTVPSTTTPTVTTPPTRTLAPAGPAAVSIFAPVRGVFAPKTGWVVSETPYVLGVASWGTPAPDKVTLNGEVLIDDDPPQRQVWYSPPIDLVPGVNRLHLSVEYLGQAVEQAVIPVTYVEGADEQLGWIAAATADSITVDFTKWNDEQEFPGPEDPDPGVLVSVPIDSEVRVVVDPVVEVDYQWLRAEVNAGYTNLQELPGFDDWNPSGVYPYVLTISDGMAVQIWKVPLG